MKFTSKRNDGFTLVELVVAIAMATIITAAATSVLLMGLRINRQTGDTASQQMTVRTLLTVVEDIISTGNVSDIEMYTDEKIAYWRIHDQSGKVLLSYFFDEEQKGTVYVGEYPEQKVNADNTDVGTPVLTGLLSSFVEMYDGLFTIHVETEEGMFSSSVLCRSLATGSNEPGSDINPGTDDEKRKKFLDILKTQYSSRGEIRIKDLVSGEYVDSGEYYSEWYINRDYDDGVYDNGWNEKTPWCACYVSWAMSHDDVKGYLQPPPAEKANWFANVDEFMAYFTKEPTQETTTWLPGGSKPTEGDLIFFDWNRGDNPQHVGVVLSVSDDGKWVYTIEGNSAGRVTVRSYPISDPRIIGYGVLLWNDTAQDTMME